MKKIRDRVKLLKEAIREECNAEPDIDIHIHPNQEEYDIPELLASQITCSLSCLGGKIHQDSGEEHNWFTNKGASIANFTVFYEERSLTSQRGAE